jgi:F0F1-type ATP synthase assembly protein I
MSVSPNVLPPRSLPPVAVPQSSLPARDASTPIIAAAVAKSVSDNIDGLHGYRKNLGTYALRIAVHAVPAIVVGLVIDKVFKKIQDTWKLKPILMIVLQILVIIAVLFVFERASISYSNEWQSNTPGFFFVSFLFGTQFNLFNNIALFGKQVARE